MMGEKKMRTLYVRVFLIIIAIMITSAVFGFIGANIYYHQFLKPENDEKVTNIAENAASIYEANNYESTNAYFSALTNLGYQFYLFDQDGNKKMYGNPFRVDEISQTEIDKVLNGETYHGIRERPWHLFITGFFDNELKNTVGIPIEMNGETHALFVRPDTVYQFGEFRTFLAVLLILTILLSFIFILISTRHIVRPIKKLTEATRRIADGNHHLKLNVKRRDEIGRLAKDFSIMSDSLARTEEKRQEFVSNVSHEIQSPLTSIQGFSQALREDDLPEAMRSRYLSIIEKESKRLSGLSKQLLTLSSLDRNEEGDRVTVDVSKQLKETVSLTEWQWRNKDIAVELDLEDGEVMGDAGLLQQIWMNLITNAIRYSNEAGTIKVRLINEKEYVNVFIIDNGVGIAKEHIPHLFERFYKTDKARTRTEESTGLGLSIVKKIIELHQGTITVESEPGKGSTFQVRLPKMPLESVNT